MTRRSIKMGITCGWQLPPPGPIEEPWRRAVGVTTPYFPYISRNWRYMKRVYFQKIQMYKIENVSSGSCQGQIHYFCCGEPFARLRHCLAGPGSKATWGLYLHESTRNMLFLYQTEVGDYRARNKGLCWPPFSGHA